MSHPDRITLLDVQTPEALQQALAIRERVFIVEQRIPADLERDGQDGASLHVLALHDGVPAATGRLTLTGGHSGVLARIAVLPACRGRGLGKRVVRHLEDLARREGLTTVTLKPHHYLEPFYRGLGYETVPGSATTAGPHRLIEMTKRL